MVLLDVTPAKERDALLDALNEPPPADVAAPARGRRPRGWGENDDLAEAESMRAMVALQRIQS